MVLHLHKLHSRFCSMKSISQFLKFNTFNTKFLVKIEREEYLYQLIPEYLLFVAQKALAASKAVFLIPRDRWSLPERYPFSLTV